MSEKLVAPPVIFHERHACTYAAEKKAPELVLLHGWGTHSGVWINWLPALTEYFHVTCIDLPGFGKSADELSCDEALKAEFFAAVLAISPQKAVWLGWSLGGVLTLEIAARYPARVQALCLLAATPCFVQRADWPSAMLPSVFSDFSKAMQESPEQALKNFVALQCKGSISMKSDIRFLQGVLGDEKIPEADALLAGLQCLSKTDARNTVKTLTTPLQFILGENDGLIPAALADVLQDLNRSVTSTVIPGAAHLPFVSHPSQCLDALLVLCRRVGVMA
jgi:pimeloyl-[acyl-carrier protein] methyl ester esterase